MEQLAEIKEKFSLSDQLVKELKANPTMVENMGKLYAITQSLESGTLPWSKGSLMYEVALALSKKNLQYDEANVKFIVSNIVNDRLKTRDQTLAAIDFVAKNASSSSSLPPPSAAGRQNIDKEKFDFACGIGVVIESKEIDQEVDKLVQKYKQLIIDTGKRSLSTIIKELKSDARMKWADSKAVKDCVDSQIKQIMDEQSKSQSAKDGAAAATKSAHSGKASTTKPRGQEDPVMDRKAALTKHQEDIQSIRDFFFTGDLGSLHKPGGNPQIKPELMQQHLKETGGIVKTRFPPEPNGHLHIGHAKAININFGYAQAHSGTCYLRYDDTNPEAEEGVYFDSILSTVQWLGYRPDEITYSSDYFQKLYELAVIMIKKDKAYACHCSGEEIHEQRGGANRGPRFDCPHRNRPIEESLAEFQKMKDGKYKEGECILRMKMDMQSGNPQFWDLVAYRVLSTPHHRTGAQWRIYPTYDYTHCLVDSFENITHSLCTVEFIASRESYYWLCDVLEVYKPVQWEYGRLNLTNTVLSKRKLTKLVQDKIVSGWDDPRLYTLVALKRRGFPPQAINQFVRDVGVSTANSTINVKRLEFFVRQHMDDNCPRLMAVMNPLMVHLVNVSDDFYQELTFDYMPKAKGVDLGSRKLPFTNTLFIDENDFAEDEDFKDVYRLRKGGIIGLLNVEYPILCIGKQVFDSVIDVDSNPVTVVKCLYLDPETAAAVKSDPSKFGLAKDFSLPAKAKTYIQWIAQSVPSKQQPGRIVSPQLVEYRNYNQLFMHENPMDKSEVPNWMDDINPESLVIDQGFGEASLVYAGDDTRPSAGSESSIPYGKCVNGKMQLGIESRVQLMRIGFFCVDSDSKPVQGVHGKGRKFYKVIKADSNDSRHIGDSLKLESLDSAPFTSGWVFNRTVNLRENTKKQLAKTK
ncbi:hypothetical protein MP228_002443 [Amoeboaphelidium protococcarum]|nr:hypothetical protein MP228_002443 [Amoeboaphelidium protococcarum]